MNKYEFVVGDKGQPVELQTTACSKVRLVKNKSNGKTYVCKEISYQNMTQPQKQQLTKEVNIFKELNKHDNIVKYQEHFITRTKEPSISLWNIANAET